MIAQSNKDYYNILLEACKEAFEALEQKDFLYTNEAMIENGEISFSSESIEHFGIEKSNEMIVQYRLREAMEYSFLTYLERQYLLLKRDMFFERKDFYRKCLTALNIEFTKFLKEGGRVPIGYNFVKNPDVILFLESMKFYLKGRAEVPDKISQIIECEPDTKNESQQLEAVIADEVKTKKELHNDIFKDNAFEVFEKYKENKQMSASDRTDLRVIFELLKNDGLLLESIELKHYIKWLNRVYFDGAIVELKKQNIKSKPNIQRTNDYKQYKKTTLKKP